MRLYDIFVNSFDAPRGNKNLGDLSWLDTPISRPEPPKKYDSLYEVSSAILGSKNNLGDISWLDKPSSRSETPKKYDSLYEVPSVILESKNNLGDISWLDVKQADCADIQTR